MGRTALHLRKGVIACAIALALVVAAFACVGGTDCAIFAIHAYQRTLSPILARSGLVRCRFEPTCSRYAEQAIQRYGVGKGTRLAGSRLLRCNPWGGSGFDPVPDLPGK